MKPRPLFLTYSLLFLLSVVWAFAFCASIPKRGVINDEAVELLQSQDLPTDRLYYFVPTYHGGHVDLIEAFVPYVNKVIRTLFGSELFLIHLFYAFCHALGVSLFFLVLREVWHERFPALYGALLLAGSSYACFFNRILTRNGISLLLTTALMLVLWKASQSRSEQNVRLCYLVYLPLICTCALLTYTSFKFLVVAIYFSLGLRIGMSKMRRGRKRQAWLTVGASLAISATLTLVLLLASHTAIQTAIFRGGYVMKGAFTFQLGRYLSHLGRSLALPFYFQPDGEFLIDVTHIAFSRQTLSFWLAPCFLVGLWHTLTAWKKHGMQFQQFAALIWISATLLLAAGGPSLKHHFALFPLVMFITCCGLRRVATWGTLIFSTRTLTRLALIILLAISGGEIFHLYRTIPNNGLLRLDSGLPRAIAQEALQHAERGTTVYIVEGWGRDAVRFYTRQHSNIRYIMNQSALPLELDATLNQHQAFAIVTEQATVPNFFKTHHSLSCCVQQHSRQENAWTIATYTSTPQCFPTKSTMDF